MMTIRYVTTAPTETSMPNIENICSGTSENPVMRSKFRRMSL